MNNNDGIDYGQGAAAPVAASVAGFNQTLEDLGIEDNVLFTQLFTAAGRSIVPAGQNTKRWAKCGNEYKQKKDYHKPYDRLCLECKDCETPVSARIDAMSTDLRRFNHMFNYHEMISLARTHAEVHHGPRPLMQGSKKLSNAQFKEIKSIDRIVEEYDDGHAAAEPDHLLQWRDGSVPVHAQSSSSLDPKGSRLVYRQSSHLRRAAD